MHLNQHYSSSFQEKKILRWDLLSCTLAFPFKIDSDLLSCITARSHVYMTICFLREAKIHLIFLYEKSGTSIWRASTWYEHT